MTAVRGSRCQGRRDGVAGGSAQRQRLNVAATTAPPRLPPHRRRAQYPTMSGQRYPWVLLALVLVSAATHAAEVTIYRCTDDRGRLTLRDSPCLKGERQEARTMLRPQDPPARAVPAPKAPASPAPAAAMTRIVVVTAPRPLYECLTPDGASYLSDTDRGEPRWQPAWNYGFRLHGPDRRRDHRRGGLPVVAPPRTLDGRVPSGLVFGNVGRPTPKPPRTGPSAPPLPPPGHDHGYLGYEAGAWVRDDCQPLPQGEVCARLRDRRYELGRRYNSALQSERAQISQEQRGIDAHLASHCGGY